MKAERPRTPFPQWRLAAAVGRRYEYDAAGDRVTCVSLSRPREGAAPVPYNVVRRRITYY